MDYLYIDSETYSDVPIDRGFNNYVEGAEITIVTYALNDDEVEIWDLTRGDPMPQNLEAWMGDKSIKLVAHSSAFDRRMFGFTALFPHADLGMSRWEDTMVQALSHGLPGGLDKLCEIFGVDADKAKHKQGRALIQFFCKPTPNGERHTEETHPAKWEEFRQYAMSDIRAMRVIHRKIPRYNYPDNAEHFNVWALDQKINQRGFAVDLELAEAAVAAAQIEKESLKGKVQDATDNEVESATKNNELLKYILESYGVKLPDLRADTLKRRIADESLPIELRQLLDLRVQSSRNAASKYKAVLKCVNADGRLRDTLQFSGAAGTGRWCLAEGSRIRVKTLQGIRTKAIEDVDLEDLVWDGDGWVSHEGVVFSGDKPVIEHDGVVATAEHKVYLSTTEAITLGEAKAKGVPLWNGD